MIDVQKIKRDFPVFENNPGLVYLDSSATSLKPQSVINKLVEYYEQYPANIKRGIYKISERATAEYESTRDVVAKFINARREEVIFTRGTTESINLLAYSLGREIVGKNDEIVTTILEHHSNFVPWQQLAFENGATFKIIDLDENNELSTDLNSVITKKTKIFALTHVSNVLGSINPIEDLVKKAKRINPNIIIILDAAQSVPHMKLDVKELGVDFIAFSGHKMLGPTGVGVLWGRKELLEEIYPFQYGGEMIEQVTLEKTTFAKIPEKFEAGTPPIAEVIALKNSVKYLTEIGLDNIKKHEIELAAYLVEQLNVKFGQDISFLLPSRGPQSGIVSFVMKDIHPHDIAQLLDEDDICIRAGHQCVMPLHTRFGIVASCRTSLYLYNDREDIDKLVKSIEKACRFIRK